MRDIPLKFTFSGREWVPMVTLDCSAGSLERIEAPANLPGINNQLEMSKHLAVCSAIIPPRMYQCVGWHSVAINHDWIRMEGWEKCVHLTETPPNIPMILYLAALQCHYHAQSHDQTNTSAHEATKRSLERDEHLGEGARGPHARTHDADFLIM